MSNVTTSGALSPVDLPAAVVFDGPKMQVSFKRFGLDAYELFLKCKKFPESEIGYEWETDTYTVSAPARFAQMLGIQPADITVDDLPFNSALFDYQRFIVEQALHARRYACYADCGLGKTLMFLEWSRQVIHQTQGRVLILSPLQIIPQTIEESRRFYGDEIPVHWIKTRTELGHWCTQEGPGLAITNYEKMVPGILNELRYLAGLVADESSILKTGGGVTKWNLIKSAKGIEFKLSCTATPAPNDVMEYASQASFLEKLRHEGEILWTFFSRDKRGVWSIKPHAQAAFYKFMSSWSIFLRSPASYGFKDNTTAIPEPVMHEHYLEMSEEQKTEYSRLCVRHGAGLFGDERLGVTLRNQLSQLAKGFLYLDGKKKIRPIESHKPGFVANLAVQEVNAGRPVLIWTVFDEEGELIRRNLPEGMCAILKGGMDETDRGEIIENFRNGKLPILISKPSLLGYGLNFQHCKAMIFSGWNDSFEQWYQAVRRAYRYGQTSALQIHVPILFELEGKILENVLRKRASFENDAAQQEHFYRLALETVL